MGCVAFREKAGVKALQQTLKPLISIVLCSSFLAFFFFFFLSNLTGVESAVLGGKLGINLHLRLSAFLKGADQLRL